MSKKEFMRRLKKRLNRLPHEEYNDAVEYYEQYFDEAKDEQTAIDKLGSPEAVAAKILVDYVDDKTKKNVGLKIWLVILAIFAAPIALPITLALVIAVFSVIFSIIVSIGAIALAGLITVTAGVLAAVLSFAFIAQSPASTIFFVGAGLVCVSLGVVIWNGAVWLISKSINGILMLGSKLLRKHV
jgi:uncharacterized membrane protein